MELLLASVLDHLPERKYFGRIEQSNSRKCAAAGLEGKRTNNNVNVVCDLRLLWVSDSLASGPVAYIT